MSLMGRRETMGSVEPPTMSTRVFQRLVQTASRSTSSWVARVRIPDSVITLQVRSNLTVIVDSGPWTPSSSTATRLITLSRKRERHYDIALFVLIPSSLPWCEVWLILNDIGQLGVLIDHTRQGRAVDFCRSCTAQF